MSEDGYVKWLEQQLQTAKEENKTNKNHIFHIYKALGLECKPYSIENPNIFDKITQLKEENEKLKNQNKLFKGIIKKFNLDWYGEEFDDLTQQNEQLREEKSLDCAMRFENNKGEFVGCLDYIAEINLDRQQMWEALENISVADELQEAINIADNALKGVE